MAEKPVKNENPYPSQYETTVVLKDGSNILIRPVKPDDAGNWVNFLQRLSMDSRYLRFQHLVGELERENAVRFCTVDYHNAFAFVAEVTHEPERRMVAAAKYYRRPDQYSAQILIVVDDEYQGRGLGQAILEQLIGAARDNSIDTFEADVRSKNAQSVGFFMNYSFHVTGETETDIYHIVFPITGGLSARDEERERKSTVASLQWLLNPKSIAIIGASRYPGTIGYMLVQCLVQSKFPGKIYPVNPNVQSLFDLPVYASVTAIPGNVEVAIIAVPAKLVARVADECGRKGVHTLIVISDGFRESGPEGASREKELRDIAFGHGMRIVGPNCMGVINTDPKVSMNATFSPIFPPRGNIGFLSQSGAMGLVVLEFASNLDMGISTFVSAGNRADISPNDLLEYWEQDPATDVILLYLESFGNPRKFARIASRVTDKKPVVVVKAGSTPAGVMAASSHTGAIATPDVVTDVVFRHTKVIRVNLMEEMFDVAALLSNQPLPKGRRLVVLTNGGGPGIIAADAAARSGLVLPQPKSEMIEKIKSILKRDIGIHNPVDTTAQASADDFHGILNLLAEDKDCDAVLFIFVPPVISSTEDVEAAIRDVADKFYRNGKPLLACFLGQRGFKARLGSSGRFVPSYPFPEEAISALAKATEYAEAKQKPAGKIPQFKDIKKNEAREIITRALTSTVERPLWLGPREINDLLSCYGLKLAGTAIAASADEAAAAASKIGFPVVVKLASDTITHKTEVGGVVLDLNSPDEVKKAFEDIRSRLDKIGRAGEMQGVQVQKMVKEGIEAIAGVSQDPTFGPLLMFGIGGIYAELIKDVVLRLNPITDLDAAEMISSLKMAKLFDGFRGAPPADIDSVKEMLLRLSAMVEDLPQLAQLDFNPVKVMPKGQGYCIVDTRIMLK